MNGTVTIAVELSKNKQKKPPKFGDCGATLDQVQKQHGNREVFLYSILQKKGVEIKCG